MKKLLLTTLVLVAGIAQADFWDNCTAYGGTIITANSYGNDKSGGLCNDPSNPHLTNNCNGKRFCISGNGMNWWSAFTWCESIGGKLAEFNIACPGSQQYPSQVAGGCPNLKGVGSGGWYETSLPWGNSGLLVINLSNGQINPSAGRGYPDRVLCQEQ